MIYKILARIFLSRDVRLLGELLAKSNMNGITVSERGTIAIDGKIIASSTEFKALRQIANRVVANKKGGRS